MQKTKNRGNGEGSIFYNSKRKCWTCQKTLGIKLDGKYYRPTVTGSTKTDAINNMLLLQSNILKDVSILEQLKSLIITPELKNQLQTSSNPKIIAELHKKTIDVNLIKQIASTEVNLSQILLNIEEEKLESNVINENTYARNLYTINHIKDSIIDIPIKEITENKIQLFLNTKKVLSQSYIDKIVNILNYAFDKAINDGIIYINPLKFLLKPVSQETKKEVIAFEVYEQNLLIDYITTHNLIITNNCNYDSDSIKNLILIGLLTGMRLGELGAIDYTKHIDFDAECFKISRTLTRDANGTTKLGTTTKTGKKTLKKGLSDVKIIPFNIFDKTSIKNILNEQIAIAKANPKNTNNLLFCNTDGKVITESSINNLFKRICRETGIKLELAKGCHFHMLRHTFATRCIEAGLQLITIAKLLGHSNTEQIEKTYGHILDKFKNEELNKLNNYYEKENIIVFPTLKKNFA